MSISFMFLAICYAETSSLDFVLFPENENISIIAGTNGTNSIQSYFNPLYSIFITPEIILKNEVALTGISIILDPETGLPNYKFPMKINVDEDAPEGKHQIHIYGRWKTRLNFSESNELKHVMVNLTILPLLNITHDKPNGCTAGKSIKFTANFAKNTSSTVYKFQKIGKIYNISTNWSTDNSWIWVTNQSDTGNNTITVNVSDKCRANWNATRTVSYLITENKPPTVTIKTKMGNYINATATDAEGDNISYQYEYKTAKDTKWSVARPWANKTDCTIQLKPGIYTIKVSVKDDYHNPKEYSPNYVTGELTISRGGGRGNTGIKFSESNEVDSKSKSNSETTSTSATKTGQITSASITKPASNPGQKSTALKSAETSIAIGIQSFDH